MQFLESLPLDLQSYLILGGVAVILIALLFYLLPISGTKMPAILACSLGALALGTGLGIIAMVGFGYHWKPVMPNASANGSDEANVDPRAKTMQGMLKGKGGDMAKGGGGAKTKGRATQGIGGK